MRAEKWTTLKRSPSSAVCRSKRAIQHRVSTMGFRGKNFGSACYIMFRFALNMIIDRPIFAPAQPNFRFRINFQLYR
jgi:hypothetical protein